MHGAFSAIAEPLVFYPHDAVLARVLAMALCLSVTSRCFIDVVGRIELVFGFLSTSHTTMGQKRGYRLMTIILSNLNRFTVFFYRAMLCIRGTSHGPVSVRMSVCPSQVGVLLKRLNVGSHKQHHTIVQGL